MYYDYHMHSSFSADSITPMEDMIRRSIELGIKEICFTEHVDYNVIKNGEEIDYDFNRNEFFDSIDRFNNKYKGKIIIKKGVEHGLQSHILDRCREDIRKYDFDFIIGSIHAIDKYELIDRHLYDGRSQVEAYRIYYETLYNIIKEYKDYSILGHLDLVKRYGDLNNIIDDRVFGDEIDEILKLVIYDGKGIEINTSSFRYNLPDLTPSSYILKRYKELGGEIITTGSDSHNTAQVGVEFKRIYEILENMGYKYVCTFDKMQPNFITL